MNRPLNYAPPSLDVFRLFLMRQVEVFEMKRLRVRIADRIAIVGAHLYGIKRQAEACRLKNRQKTAMESTPFGLSALDVFQLFFGGGHA
jgi:hypothetical protein